MTKANEAAIDYGIDAPGVIRNLAIAGAAGVFLWAGVSFGLLPRALVWTSSGKPIVRIGLGSLGLGPGIGCSAMALWMLWSSKVGKKRERERLLDRIPWRGDERVLDVGCGRGLVLIGAARRLDSGSAYGIDVWQASDLSGNRPSATLQNARAEGVSARVRIQTADMRHLPFRDGSFDVVTSNAAVHNLDAPEDRAAAIRDIARVLKPGGHAFISDIRHHRQYANVFGANGCGGARLVESRVLEVLLGIVTFGSLRPNTLLVRKSA